MQQNRSNEDDGPLPFEERACQLVVDLLDDRPLGIVDAPSEETRPLLNCLEFFLPTVLSMVYGEWRYDSFDDVAHKRISKIASHHLALVGEALPFSTYQYTPIEFDIEVSESGTRIKRCELLVGKNSEPGSSFFHMEYDPPAIS